MSGFLGSINFKGQIVLRDKKIESCKFVSEMPKSFNFFIYHKIVANFIKASSLQKKKNEKKPILILYYSFYILF